MTENPPSFEMPDNDVTVTAGYVPKQDGPDGNQDKDDDPATPTQTPGSTDKPSGGNGQGGTTVTPKPGCDWIRAAYRLTEMVGARLF